MRKKLFIGISAVAVVAVAAVNVNYALQGNKNLSALALANVEALAQEGNVTNVITCYSTYRVSLKNPNKPEPLWNITKCNGCVEVSCFEYSDQGTCTKSSSHYA